MAMYNSGGHTILYLTNESPAKCEILYDSKVYTPMINVVIKSCNKTTNSLRQAFLYLTNNSFPKCGNWYDGKAYYLNYIKYLGNLKCI